MGQTYNQIASKYNSISNWLAKTGWACFCQANSSRGHGFFIHTPNRVFYIYIYGFDYVDERNTMVKFNLQFREVYEIGLTGLENRLSIFSARWFFQSCIFFIQTRNWTIFICFPVVSTRGTQRWSLFCILTVNSNPSLICERELLAPGSS